MLAFLACFIFGSNLLPVHTGGYEPIPLPCNFPFFFDGKSYTSCTKDGAIDEQLWCATTANYDKHGRWRSCSLQEYGGNSGGNACIFPFIYKNRTFYTCTNEERGRFWCATVRNYDWDPKWSYCADTRLNADPKGPCVFPFLYNRTSYSSCTTDGISNKKPWCSLTSNYDVDLQWTYCEPSGPDSNGGSPSCVFPFIYNDKSYSTCMTEGMNDGKFWCATTSNFDVDKKWVYCNVTGLDADPKLLCHFPFMYNHKFYSSCTTDGMYGKKPWCSLTVNYNADLQWTYCEPSGPGDTMESPCVFPFIFRGKFYHNCTTDGLGDGKLWCATTSNYVGDMNWKLCEDSESETPLAPALVDPQTISPTSVLLTVPQTIAPTFVLPSSGPKAESPSCVFPFIYNGATYSTCTSEGMNDGSFWCATSSNFDMDMEWMYCNVTGPDPNVEGPSCVFPFIYKGKSYSTCTLEGMIDEIFWCATTSNYDMDKNWMYCNVTGPDDTVESPPCVFPFIFKGKSYHTCTTDGQSSGSFWCATTSNYDADKKWKFCEDPDPDPNVESPSCIFPFIYNGKSFSTCTREGMSDGSFWCATTSNYDVDKKWAYCNVTGPDMSVETPRCVFPFIYNGKNYSGCTEDGRKDGKLWCATTGSYDEDEKWIFCTVTKTGCVFPFIYKGRSHHSCTTLDHLEGRAWCSTTPDYHTGLQWRVCNATDCVFPFEYQGKSYNSCTRDGRADKRRWCSLASNADTGKTWILC
ncbi:uncharacterized protein LOC128330723 [Hemicordylus capensis]|uniref:uncharacterized protein LOC128330723 n=1 Tax=Hemicordylus capensis TaxID=884348 RepID=UPI00230315BA|nr:uncharacterized protein LOC128330723 [Hemicordylus capensis]XP_053119944.1 uncharacterized protein LOC128330723 [Hemicordylus capensis]